MSSKYANDHDRNQKPQPYRPRQIKIEITLDCGTPYKASVAQGGQQENGLIRAAQAYDAKPQ